MTWKECRETALRKMFGANGGVLDEQEEWTRDCLRAMPGAANEAIWRICAIRPLRRSAVLEAEPGRSLDLTEWAPDFWSCGSGVELYALEGPGGPAALPGRVLGGRFLMLPEGAAGRLLFCYDARPTPLPPDPAEDTVLPLDEEGSTLVPLYLAGELYKDDDVTTATLFMNEFEAKLADLREQDRGIVENSFCSVTGWW